jgi:DDE family transposase
VLDPETFLVELYVPVDEFCKEHLPPERRPGPAAALCRSEVITLALFAQWARFRSERDFWRYATAHLRPLFPTLPGRAQFNRQMRRHRDAIAAFALWLAERLGAPQASYEVLDSTAAPTRNAKRRGRGWLPGLADIGWSNRLGWYEGFHVLAVAAPSGAVTGFGFGPASSNDRALAEVLFAQRAAPAPRLPSAGQTATGVYVADSGFAGVACEARWVADHQAQVVAPPQEGSGRAWPPPKRRQLARLRQVIETVFDHLLFAFRLERDRPHELDGFQARLAAKVALHNFCLWLNRRLGQPDLAFAELLGW